jgi:hypothetical protein
MDVLAIRDEQVKRIHRKTAYNSRFLGQIEETMFFSVANHGGKTGKMLFDNPAEYARCIGVVLDEACHQRFKERVQTFLQSLPEKRQADMKNLNASWGTYHVEAAEEFEQLTPGEPAMTSEYDELDDAATLPSWQVSTPPTGCWGDYE